MKNNFDLFKTKKITAIFAVIALIAGFFFLNQNITGNTILDNGYSFDIISLVGLLLILCSAILGIYSIRKK